MGLFLLCLVPVFPLLGSIMLTALSGRLTHREARRIGVGSMALSASVTAWLLLAYWLRKPVEVLDEATGQVLQTGRLPYTQHLWSWMDIGGLGGNMAFHLDALSLIMIVVITGVGYLIHVYSTEYMLGDAQYSRFFACMNLFVASMLVLVLADNFLLLFLGWEGVGLCSYLLIGFWYDNAANTRAANKAFLVTRIGDVFMMLALLLIYREFGTLHISTVLHQAPAVWVGGGLIATLTAGLLLGGALGKSGQVPLQVWLPDAMAGPTPVSALIHAATMVTAGVYLIARTNVLFELAPQVQQLVAVLGAASIIIAGLAALAQTDIKRVLAYSTISQVGYMFLALGVGAYSAAMFHFFTHALFKALLFMSAGAIIVALHHEQNIFKMGGLRKSLKTVWLTFLIGAMSLAAVPYVTSGFFSKEAILHAAATAPGGMGFFWVGVIGAFITGLYTFRLIFIVFFGEEHGHVHHQPGKALTRPLVILAVLATAAGFLDWPWHGFSHFMEGALPALSHHGDMSLGLTVLASTAGLVGIALAWVIWFPRGAKAVQADEEPRGLRGFFHGGLGFDTLYAGLIAWPYVESAHANRRDVLHLPAFAIRQGIYGMGLMLRGTQNGKLRWYLAVMAGGVAAAIYLVAFR